MIFIRGGNPSGEPNPDLAKAVDHLLEQERREIMTIKEFFKKHDMKIDEIIFFFYSYTLRTNYNWTIRDVVNLLDGQIHHKRCWYYLKKWSRLGFYNYGVSLDLGWFETYKLPERYRYILDTFNK